MVWVRITFLDIYLPKLIEIDETYFYFCVIKTQQKFKFVKMRVFVILIINFDVIVIFPLGSFTDETISILFNCT